MYGIALQFTQWTDQFVHFLNENLLQIDNI